MAEAAGKYHAFLVFDGTQEVQFLAHIIADLSGRRFGHHDARGVIQGIVRICKPVGAVFTAHNPVFARLYLNPGAYMANIFPPYLVGKPVEIMTRWKKLIEGPACAIRSIVISGGIIVFREKTRREMSGRECVTQDPVTCPCRNRV